MKNFFDTKDEKITEKAFTQSVIISVLSILLCIVALCSATFAWFTGSTSSGNNTLMSGTFDIDVTVSVSQITEGAETASEAEQIISENGIYTLAAKTKYVVELTPTTETTVKGYCVVTVNGKEAYRTDVIVNEKTVSEAYPTVNSPFIFTIETGDAEAKVEIVSHWGVPAEPTVKKEGTIKIGVSQDTATETETAAAE